MSAGEDLFAMHLQAAKIEFVQEYRFARPRKFRADFWILALPDILVEIEGGVWVQGRHNRGSGFVVDIEKYNLAAELGYRLLRFVTDDVEKGIALQTIERVIENERRHEFGIAYQRHLFGNRNPEAADQK